MTPSAAPMTATSRAARIRCAEVEPARERVEPPAAAGNEGMLMGVVNPWEWRETPMTESGASVPPSGGPSEWRLLKVTCSDHATRPLAHEFTPYKADATLSGASWGIAPVMVAPNRSDSRHRKSLVSVGDHSRGPLTRG